jgi:inorganic phosphate transporter, PiT family
LTVGTAAAALFAVFTGFNDAGALVGIGLRALGMRLLPAVTLLVAAVVTVPLIVGAGVASTLTGRLVSFGDDHVPLLIGITAAIAVTVALAARGLPTSLTLALIGGISGAGIGAHAAVDWWVVGTVLALAAAAPLVGTAGALLLIRLVAHHPARNGAGVRLRRLHLAGFAACCLAYGANDGQKMLAVFAAVSAVSPQGLVGSVGTQVAIAVCFVTGALLGMRRLAASIGGGLASSAQDAVVATELAGATVVFATAALGAPVSMTQSLSGAMIGTGLARRARRVRWRSVLRLGAAWLLTLPSALAVATAATVVAARC